MRAATSIVLALCAFTVSAAPRRRGPVVVAERNPRGTLDQENPAIGQVNKTGGSPFWQKGDKFEGDMSVTSFNRNGDPDPSHRWPGAILPYAFATDHFTSEQQRFIMDSLRQFDRSCLRVRPWQGEPNYVILTRYGTGCHSKIGYMRSGQQQLNLQNNPQGTCLSTGTVVHEFLHAAGFYHQQSAIERDGYVAIDFNNIERDKWSNFDKYNTNNYGVGYDYRSVMHYNNYAFAIDQNRQTIWARSNPSLRLGNDDGMTASDFAKLQAMYC